MGSIDVTGWPPTKVAAVVQAIDDRSTVRLTWTPPPERPLETPADAARRLALVRDRLKG